METPPSEPPSEPPSDDATPQTPSSSAPSTGRSGLPSWAWIAGGVVLVLVVIGVVVVAAGSGSEAQYDDTVRDRFISACTAEGGEPVRSTCECIYTKVEAEIPFVRFEEVDTQLAEQASTKPPGSPLELPADIEAIRVACVTSTS